MLTIYFLNLLFIVKSMDMFHNAFSDDSYKYMWKINESQQTITFTLDVATLGWVGIGFSSDGRMLNSDSIICYIDKSQKCICTDRYSNSYSTPPTDTLLGGKDDLTDISGKYENGRTSVSFTRKLDTGDKYDYAIKKGIDVNVLFSYRIDGNPDSENGVFNKHSKAGGKKLILYEIPNSNITDSYKHSDKTWSMDIKFDGFNIPAIKTYYACKFYDINQIATNITGKNKDVSYHAIAIEPIVDNVERLHHMVLYGCNITSLEGRTKDIFECGKMLKECNNVVYGWAPGSPTVLLPKEAGIIWGTEDLKYGVLQIHYDNPPMKSEIDSSGIKIWYTTELRTFDAGIMIIGMVHQLMNIPAGQKKFEVMGKCGAPCIASGDITVFGYFPHGHKYATGIKTELTTVDGKIDQTSLAIDNFRFDSQRQYILKTPIILKPGWSANTFCYYNTENSNQPIKGGEDSDQEMCFNFIAYYPKENGFNHCFNGIGSLGCKMNSKVDRVLASNIIKISQTLFIFMLIIFK